MEADHRNIAGHETVVTALGKWPSFHDAEVVSIVLERNAGEDLTPPQMTVTLHAFRLEVAADDPARNDCRITLLFRGIEQLRLADFNNQNAINGISITSHRSDQLQREVFKVKFHPGFGVSGDFQCDEIEVLSVRPMPVKGG